MNFEEFKQQLMEDLKEALSRRVGTEVAVEENEVQKLQQESYDGIVVRKENESIARSRKVSGRESNADGKEAICYGRFAIEKDAGSRRKEEGIATRL